MSLTRLPANFATNPGAKLDMKLTVLNRFDNSLGGLTLEQVFQTRLALSQLSAGALANHDSSVLQHNPKAFRRVTSYVALYNAATRVYSRKLSEHYD